MDNMEGNYCEARAKKIKTAGDIGIKVLLIAGIVLSIFAALIFAQTLIVLAAVILGVVAYIVIPRLNVEYEYVFCDGQLDFDKIMNGEKRKHLSRVDMEQVTVVAPIKSHALDGYRREGVRGVLCAGRED